MGKEEFATVTYQVAVDHSGFAPGVTVGFPGAENDKTIMQYDGTIQKIRHDPKNPQLEYKLVDSEGNKYTEKGAYIIVDGGYHKVFNSRGRTYILGYVHVIRVAPVPLKTPGDDSDSCYLRRSI
ncbi:unnamed protein product [Discosporangium mesarthrocarpum]